MEKLRRISKAALLALTLTMATLMASMPAAAPQQGKMRTYAVISACPNPVGVNQVRSRKDKSVKNVRTKEWRNKRQ